MKAEELKVIEGHELGALLLRAGLRIVKLEDKLKEANNELQ